MLNVTGNEATHTCKDTNLCVGLKAVIYGAVHGVQYIWDANYTEENWGFLLVDININFNEINQIGMLWTFRHLYPSRVRFFNCHCHHYSLVL